MKRARNAVRAMADFILAATSRGGLPASMASGASFPIEPIVSAGSGAVREAGDGWTLRTADGALSAHAEHTLVVRRGQPLVLTA